MSGPYDDIINLPRPVSKHQPMSRHDRAAQFSPFAALTGYEELIREAGRTVEADALPDESAAAELNRQLNYLLEHAEDRPEAEAEYFRPDGKKPGGQLRSVRGIISRVLPAEQKLIFADGTEISFPQLRRLRTALPEQ